MQQYTNELSTELLVSMDTPRFSAEELTEMSEEALALIEEQAAFCRSHPVIAIYRIAVAGSLTLRGGVADEFNPDPMQGYKILRDDEQMASVLTVGCRVTYPDGSTARIVSSAGSQYAIDECGIALVGSVLDNGDIIISTPQRSGVLVGREGVDMPVDFLIAGHK